MHSLKGVILAMDVSVVVPTYNQAALLTECLRALRTQTLAPEAYEIIVVDDASTDQTPAVLAAFAAPPRPVTVVPSPHNRGRSAARNAGISRAAAPLIVFIDSDVIVRGDFLEWHLRTHREHGPGTLSRGPVVLVSDVTAAQNGQVPRFAASPAYLDTANAAVEKAALLRAGLFDEGFAGYGWEDFELGVRLKRIGIRRTFCRQAVAFHVYPPTLWDSFDDLLRKERERAQSAVYFYRKHPTFATRWLIQATRVHRTLYWLQAGCGLLRPQNIDAVVRRLRGAKLETLAYLAARGVLNRYYLQKLTAGLKRHTAQNA